MVDALVRTLRLTSRMLVRHRILLSAGLSAAAGIILRVLVVIPIGNPLFQYMAVDRFDLYRAFVWSFTIFSVHDAIHCAVYVLFARLHPLLLIPTPDHYLPMLYVIATKQQGEIITFPIEGVDGGSISMLTVQVG